MEGQVKKRQREVNAGTGEEKGGSLGGRFKGASRNSEFTRRLFSLLSLPPPFSPFSLHSRVVVKYSQPQSSPHWLSVATPLFLFHLQAV